MGIMKGILGISLILASSIIIIYTVQIRYMDGTVVSDRSFPLVEESYHVRSGDILCVYHSVGWLGVFNSTSLLMEVDIPEAWEPPEELKPPHLAINGTLVAVALDNTLYVVDIISHTMNSSNFDTPVLTFRDGYVINDSFYRYDGSFVRHLSRIPVDAFPGTNIAVAIEGNSFVIFDILTDFVITTISSQETEITALAYLGDYNDDSKDEYAILVAPDNLVIFSSDGIIKTLELPGTTLYVLHDLSGKARAIATGGRCSVVELTSFSKHSFDMIFGGILPDMDGDGVEDIVLMGMETGPPYLHYISSINGDELLNFKAEPAFFYVLSSSKYVMISTFGVLVFDINTRPIPLFMARLEYTVGFIFAIFLLVAGLILSADIGRNRKLYAKAFRAFYRTIIWVYLPLGIFLGFFLGLVLIPLNTTAFPSHLIGAAQTLQAAVIILVLVSLSPAFFSMYSKIAPSIAMGMIRLRLRLARVSSRDTEIRVTETGVSLPAAKKLKRYLIPFLLALTVGTMSYQSLATVSQFPSLGSEEMYHTIYDFFMFFTLPVIGAYIVAMFYLGPIWLLDDAGIIIKIKPPADQRIPPRVIPVGETYMGSFRGIVGLGALVTYGEFIVNSPFSRMLWHILLGEAPSSELIIVSSAVFSVVMAPLLLSLVILGFINLTVELGAIPARISLYQKMITAGYNAIPSRIEIKENPEFMKKFEKMILKWKETVM